MVSELKDMNDKKRNKLIKKRNKQLKKRRNKRHFFAGKLLVLSLISSLFGCNNGGKKALDKDEESEWNSCEDQTLEIDEAIPFSYLMNNADENDNREIVCWGDSMTAGNGSADGQVAIRGVVYDISGLSYPEILEGLTGLKTYNFGIPGATSEEIAIMQGALTVPQSAEFVKAMKTVNDGSKPAGFDYTGPREQYIKQEFIDEGKKHPGDILILEIGSNGGWYNDYSILVGQYRAMIEHSGCEDYIIIGDTDDPQCSADVNVRAQAEFFESVQNKINDGSIRKDVFYNYISETIWDMALEAEFGDHFINMRRYILEKGMLLCGLYPTVEEEEELKLGIIPDSLRSDWTHFSSYGYYVQAVAVYEKGIELGYWK